MKTLLSIASICTMALCFTFPAIELNDVLKQKMKGSVKSVMEIRYTLTDTTPSATRDKIIHQKYISFNKLGFEESSILYRDGVPDIQSSTIFRSDGKPSGRKETKGDGSFNLSVSYSYDEKDRISEGHYQWEEEYEVGIFSDNSDYFFDVVKNEAFSKVIYSYEYRGYVTGEKYIKDDGSTSFTFTSRYDARGNKTESIYFHGNGRTSWVTKFKYDRYDNLIESNIIKDNRIVVTSTYTHQYDEIGNWIVRREKRNVTPNIHTANLEKADMVTERSIEYY